MTSHPTFSVTIIRTDADGTRRTLGTDGYPELRAALFDARELAKDAGWHAENFAPAGSWIDRLRERGDR